MGSAIRYFACARRSDPPSKARPFGLILATKAPGENHVTEWTGDYFRTWKEAVTEMERRNRKLFDGKAVA